MCHSLDPTAGRTHPDPRNPSNRSASSVPARSHASIWSSCAGSTRRVIETVTGAAMGSA
jgi:hypothetical protein